MNKMLIAVFETELAADDGLKALHQLHAQGDITLYSTGVIGKSDSGVVSIKKPMGHGPVGTATGLAVGSLLGLLGGPIGLVVGAVTGTVVGAVRDFWVAGVGLDFIEEAESHLQPGRVALVAEVEEEWVIPVDSALEAVGGKVSRRTREQVADHHYERDVAAFKSEIKSLEAEASHASGVASDKLQTKIHAAKASLDDAVQNARDRADLLKQEADAKIDALKAQLDEVTEDVKSRIEARIKRVNSSYHARGTKLSQAWELTKEALSM
jgi:uncharacterized membrane protein